MAGQSKLAADEAEDSVWNLGRDSRRLFKQAWQLYKEDETLDQHFRIYKHLLSYAQPGHAHKAAYHRLIAQTTNDDFLSVRKCLAQTSTDLLLYIPCRAITQYVWLQQSLHGPSR